MSIIIILSDEINQSINLPILTWTSLDRMMPRLLAAWQKKMPDWRPANRSDCRALSRREASANVSTSVPPPPPGPPPLERSTLPPATPETCEGAKVPPKLDTADRGTGCAWPEVLVRRNQVRVGVGWPAATQWMAALLLSAANQSWADGSLRKLGACLLPPLASTQLMTWSGRERRTHD